MIEVWRFSMRAYSSVRIETITVPEEPIFSIALKTGYNSQSTFRKRAAFPGSSTDWLGFDSGMRQLPDEVPRDYPVRNGTVKPDGERLRREEMDEIGQNMNNAMGPHERRNLPNLGGSVIWGNGWDLAKDARLGALASLTYSRKPSLREETIREFNFTGDGDTLGKWIDAKGMTATDTVRWGAFGSIGLEFA